MPAANAISLRELRTGASGPGGPGARSRPKLAGLSLDVPQGVAVALVGASGAGKTTVLHAASGLLDLVSGRVLAEGRDVTQLPPHRRGVPLVANEHALRGMGRVSFGTVEAAVRLAARGLDVRPILQATALTHLARASLSGLGAAVLRRVGLAQAVASAPACLLVDEPARGLGRADAGEFFAALRAVREAGVAMLVATSDTGTAMALAERAVVMADGSARQAGWLRELHDAPADDSTAGLLGPINRLPGRVTAEEDDIVTVRLDCGRSSRRVARTLRSARNAWSASVRDASRWPR